jgi:hypothetical protein
MTSPAARARCPAMPPGWTAGLSAGRAGERTGIDCAGLPSGTAPGGGQRGGAEREGPGARGRWFFSPGQ